MTAVHTVGRSVFGTHASIVKLGQALRRAPARLGRLERTQPVKRAVCWLGCLVHAAQALPRTQPGTLLQRILPGIRSRIPPGTRPLRLRTQHGIRSRSPPGIQPPRLRTQPGTLLQRIQHGTLLLQLRIQHVTPLQRIQPGIRTRIQPVRPGRIQVSSHLPSLAGAAPAAAAAGSWWVSRPRCGLPGRKGVETQAPSRTGSCLPALGHRRRRHHRQARRRPRPPRCQPPHPARGPRRGEGSWQEGRGGGRGRGRAQIAA